MKTKGLLRVLLSMMLAIVVLSCSKDDEQVVPQTSVVDQQPNTPTGQNSVGNGSSDGGSGNADETVLATYQVNGDVLTLINRNSVSGNLAQYASQEMHDRVWNFFTSIVPASVRPQLKKLIIFGGDDGTAAYVAPINDDIAQWEMGINIQYAFVDGNNLDINELAHTAIHEYGHIMTLKAGQLNANVGQASCSNYFPGEGCAEDQSYINKFFDNYWKDIYAEHQQAERGGDISAFYNKYKSRFVSDYAATNPGEDIAESFAIFALKSNPDGGTIASKKEKSFYDYSELVSLWEQMRQGMQKYNVSLARMAETHKSYRLKHKCVRH